MADSEFALRSDSEKMFPHLSLKAKLDGKRMGVNMQFTQVLNLINIILKSVWKSCAAYKKNLIWKLERF